MDERTTRLVEAITAPRHPVQLIAQLDLRCADDGDVRRVLGALHETWTSPAVPPVHPVCVGFSARFFRGPLTPTRDAVGRATRHAVGRSVPADLGRMSCRYDNRFPGLRTEAELRDAESDLIVVVEGDDADELRRRAAEVASIPGVTASRPHLGATGGRDQQPLGMGEGISNLQDVAEDDPGRLRRIVTSDAPGAEGGTYVVYRRYLVDRARWTATAPDERTRIVGRRTEDDRVVDRETGEPLEREADEAQAGRADPTSHVVKANPRGQGRTSFGDPVALREARILRRGSHFRDDATGQVGVHFLCFQGDIRRGGFEFIHNEWVMSQLNGGRDRLLDPDAGLVRPTTGCYYYAPPWERFPGDVLVASA